MPIVFDLTADQGVPRRSDGATVLGFAELTSAARRPRALLELLWGQKHDRVELREDSIPKSAKQALATLLIGFARTERRELDASGETREIGALGLVAHGFAELVRALPREIAQTVALKRRARSEIAAERQLPRRAGKGRPHRVLYVRGNPTMNWRGQAVGGSFTHMTGVVNGMLDCGAEVEVLARASLSGLRADVRRVPVRRVFHFEPWLTMAAYADALLAASEDIAADVVYQRYAPGSLAGLRIADRKRIPLILEYNGSELWVDRHWGPRGRPSRGFELQEEIELRTLEEASLIVVVSDPLREQLVERGIDADLIMVNPNGVDTDALAPFRAGTTVRWRREVGLLEAPSVGFIGTFGLWHGVLDLPAMIAALAESHPQARWLLVGDGQHWGAVAADLESRGLSDRVTMPGALPREQALRMLAAADVCVSPHVPNPDGSRFFGSPTKLFEYMGLGKAIVASDLEQIGEVLDDGVTGLLHEPGDVDAAARAIGRLLDDDTLRSSLGAAALAEAEARYTWRAHSQRILERIGGSTLATPAR